MDLSHPLSVLTPTLDADVLAVLAAADVTLTPGDVHRILGRRSEEGVRKALERLSMQGIVDRSRAGRAFLYSLNRDHLAAPAILEITASRQRLLERLRAHVVAWPNPPLFGALFGSATGRAHSARSDIDLLVIRPDASDDDSWAIHTWQLSVDVTRWTGNDARVLDFLESGLRSEPVLDDITREGLVFVGDPDWLARAVSPSSQ